MKKFDLNVRGERASYLLTFRSRLTMLMQADSLNEDQWMNAFSNLLTDWFAYESQFVTGRRSIIDVLVSRRILKLPEVTNHG